MTGVNPTYVAVLDDRGVVSVTGADAEKLLAGLVTNDMALLAAQPAIHAGLLSPQGKILFDFFVVKAADGFRIETLRETAGALVKRLGLYKLRAAVEIRDESDSCAVAACWGGDPCAATAGLDGVLAYPDPRLASLGVRMIVDAANVDRVLAGPGCRAATAQDYHAHRIGLGVPEAGRDFVLGDTFPHEALFDQLGGVSFTKGCFVGQEVVSRMQHRGTARKRVVPVVAERPLPAGPRAVVVGGVEIGRLGSVDGARGLALLRLDRVEGAERDGVPMLVDDVAVRVALPAFATFRIGASA